MKPYHNTSRHPTFMRHAHRTISTRPTVRIDSDSIHPFPMDPFPSQAQYSSTDWEAILEEILGQRRMIDMMTNPDNPKVVVCSTIMNVSPLEMMLWRNYGYRPDQEPVYKVRVYIVSYALHWTFFARLFHFQFDLCGDTNQTTPFVDDVTISCRCTYPISLFAYWQRVFLSVIIGLFGPLVSVPCLKSGFLFQLVGMTCSHNCVPFVTFGVLEGVSSRFRGRSLRIKDNT